MLFNNLILDAIPKADTRKLSEVCDALQFIGDYACKNAKRLEKRLTYRCHSIARALAANIAGLTVHDGWYLGLVLAKDAETLEVTCSISHCDHSWLTTESGTIIDPYPVGCLNVNPLIIPKTAYSHYGYDLYLENNEGKAAANKPEFLKETVYLRRLLRLALKQKTA